MLLRATLLCGVGATLVQAMFRGSSSEAELNIDPEGMEIDPGAQTFQENQFRGLNEEADDHIMEVTEEEVPISTMSSSWFP